MNSKLLNQPKPVQISGSDSKKEPAAELYKKDFDSNDESLHENCPFMFYIALQKKSKYILW